MSPTVDQDRVILPQVADGFTYNTYLNYLPGWFAPHALAQMAILRRAANRIPRFYVVTGSTTQQGTANSVITIPAYQTLRYTLWIPPDSYLWGYSLIMITEPNVLNLPTNPADVAVQVTDATTGIPLFEDFILGQALSPDFTSRTLPILLTQPKIITPPGDILVELSNRTGQTDAPDPAQIIAVNFMLCVSQPCLIPDEDQRDTSGKIVRR